MLMGVQFIVAQEPPVTQAPPPIAFLPWQAGRSDEVTREYSTSFPSAYSSGIPENDTVYVRALLPADSVGQVPTVILLHYWGASDQRLEERLAARLNRRRVGAILIQLPYHLSRTPAGFASGALAIQPDPVKLRQTMIQSVLDIRRTIDWMATRPEIDSSRIGLSGTSLGSIVGSLAAGVEPRITHMCFILGGVDLAKMLWNSSRVVSQRETLRRSGITESSLREALKPVEPSEYLGSAAPRPALVIRAQFDTVVPSECTDQLVSLLNDPQVIVLKTGHFGGVFAERPILNAVAEFYQQRFFGVGRATLTRTLSAPTIRLGSLYDGVDRLQVAASVDLWRSNAKADQFFSAVLSPRGPRLYLGTNLGGGLSLGAIGTPKRVSFGLFWSFVL